MMLVQKKCEVHTLVYQRLVQFHSVDGALPTDADAIKFIRKEETFIEARGDSHLHTVDELDSIEDAITLDDAVVAATDKIAIQEKELSQIDQAEIDKYKVLISIGQSIEYISKLTKHSPEIIKLALSR